MEQPASDVAEPTGDQTTEPAGTGEEPVVGVRVGSEDSPRDHRYRQQLRQVEQERDALREALLSHLRRDVEALAVEKLTAGSPLRLLPGLGPRHLVDDKPAFDAEKVEAAVARLLEHTPQLV